jgi:hypothetical protein
MFIVITYFYFKKLIISDSYLHFPKFIIFLKSSIFLLSSSLILGLLGFGFSTYGESSVGNKSYFNGANDLGVALLILFSFVVYYLNFLKLSAIYKYLILVPFFILFFSVSTKLSMIGSVVSFFFVHYIVKYRIRKVNLIKILIVFSISLIIGFSVIYKLFLESDAYDRLVMLYEKHDDIGFLIFSGRQAYLEREIVGFFSSNFINQIFGLGRGVTIELDFFDVLFNYGYFGLIIVYGFYISLFFTALRNSKNPSYPFAPYVVFINILLTFISLLSGHVLFSAMGGVFISFVNSLSFYKSINR